MQDKSHAVVGPVDFGLGVDLGKGETETAVILDEGLDSLRHLVGVVGLAGLDGDQRLEFVLTFKEIAFELDTGHRETFALGDVDGHRNILLVRGNGDLGGIDLELQVAARQVVGAQGFDICIELGPRITVRLGVPAQPAAGVQIEQAAQCGLAEHLVADNADFLDLGDIAFGHAEGHVDPVALDRRDGGHHLGAVKAAVDVLPLELLLGAVCQCLVERPAIGEPDFAQRLLEHFLVKLLGPDEVHVGHGRAFLDDHDQHVTADFKPYVLEQAQPEQRADRTGSLVVVVGLTDTERQRGKNGSRLDALQAFHADIAHGERIHGPGCMRDEKAGHHRGNAADLESFDLFLHEKYGVNPKAGRHR